MRAEFCIFESNAPGLKANFYEPYVDKPTLCTRLQLLLCQGQRFAHKSYHKKSFSRDFSSETLP